MNQESTLHIRKFDVFHSVDVMWKDRRPTDFVGGEIVDQQTSYPNVPHQEKTRKI